MVCGGHVVLLLFRNLVLGLIRVSVRRAELVVRVD
jgi:hypothetical protein